MIELKDRKRLLDCLNELKDIFNADAAILKGDFPLRKRQNLTVEIIGGNTELLNNWSVEPGEEINGADRGDGTKNSKAVYPGI